MDKSFFIKFIDKHDAFFIGSHLFFLLSEKSQEVSGKEYANVVNMIDKYPSIRIDFAEYFIDQIITNAEYKRIARRFSQHENVRLAVLSKSALF